tara:strand:+ start:36758 stop:37612 length:855 start_codon:yes stop_codon:yes gene_type:complete
MEHLRLGNIMKLITNFFLFYKNDPRRLQFMMLWSYSIIALEIFNHERPHTVTIITFLSTLVTDKFLGHFFHKKKNSFLPAAIISPSICTLCYSIAFWPYILAGVLSAVSKSLLLYKGRHIFNPSNFGITVTILLFPNWITGISNVFSGMKFVGVYFLISGLINAINSRTLHISIMYLIGMSLSFWLRGVFIDRMLAPSVFIELTLNPILLIFCFHMINDPATTPRSKKLGMLYGFFLGVLYVIFSINGSTHGHFYSLFIITMFIPFLRDYEEKQRNKVLASAAT